MQDWELLLTDVHLATMSQGATAYGIVEDAAIAVSDGNIAWLGASALQKSTFKIARTRLLRDGLVNHEGTLYRVTETNEGQGQG